MTMTPSSNSSCVCVCVCVWLFVCFFSVSFLSNIGDRAGVERGLHAMFEHPFGNHSYCDESWCTHVTEPDAKYRSLPFGKPLKDSTLQLALKQIFLSYLPHAGRLATLGSTQANENFNSSASAKAQKRHFLSASATLDYRIAATVSQKNQGRCYVVNVS